MAAAYREAPRGLRVATHACGMSVVRRGLNGRACTARSAPLAGDGYGGDAAHALLTGLALSLERDIEIQSPAPSIKHHSHDGIAIVLDHATLSGATVQDANSACRRQYLLHGR